MLTAEQLLKEIDDLWSNENESERGYIGASEIGHHCTRYLWLKFHRVTFPEKFNPRMLRLFRRGHAEEVVLQAQLQALGFEVVESCLKQGGFKRGFFAGHWDGKVSRDGKTYTVEYKTFSEKQFKLLLIDGVKEAKPQHYAQSCIYAREQDSDGIIYIAVCKNDDNLHIEVFPRDDEHAEAMRRKAIEEVAKPFKLPAKIAKTPADYRCKMCSSSSICHGLASARIDCRNCVHADKDTAAGTFKCELGNKELKPCENHSFNPYILQDLYGVKINDVDQETKTIHFLRNDGTDFFAGKNGLSSDDVLHLLVD